MRSIINHDRRWRRGLAGTAVAALALAGCSGTTDDEPDATDGATENGAADDGTAEDGAAEDGAAEDGQAADDLEQPTDEDLPDPTESIEDGIYRANGVALPVPDAWSVDPASAAQGYAWATSDDGSQHLTGQAVDSDAAAESGGEEMDLDSLIAGLLDQVGQEPDVEEEIEVGGAERAQRLTFNELPGNEEGAEESSATLVLAESEDGQLGEFVYSATTDGYDDDIEAQFLDTVGFDEDSA